MKKAIRVLAVGAIFASMPFVAYLASAADAPPPDVQGGIPTYDQCFPWVYLDYMYNNGVIGSLGLALHNQELCRAERFKVAGY